MRWDRAALAPDAAGEAYLTEVDRRMRSELGRERRLFAVGEGDYEDVEDCFALFVERAEAIISVSHDEEVAYNTRLTAQQ